MRLPPISSGSEEIYKLYAESFKGEAHLRKTQEDARLIFDKVLKEASGPVGIAPKI